MGSDIRPTCPSIQLCVSIHAPTWGATQTRQLKKLRNLFQSTLPHGERPSRQDDELTKRMFQSTLPHGERPALLFVNSFGVEVSIHAPTWGATFTPEPQKDGNLGFNPRSHMGSDFTLTRRPFAIEVSIHAPTWGATMWRSRIMTASSFQSTLPHGERLSP